MKTPRKINYLLTRMTEVSMEMEFDELQSLSPKQRQIWKKLTRAMDRTCEAVQEYFREQQ